jgi:uncharacterized membrane protein
MVDLHFGRLWDKIKTNKPKGDNPMKNKKLMFVISVGLMAALVFVGNYIQIKIPNGVLITRIHFGNSMCLLAGLLLGGLGGGLASGIGAAIYDLLDPAFIISAPFTFLSKFAMGFLCGVLASRIRGEKKTAIIGQLAYIFMYLSKTYIGQLLLGAAQGTALSATATNAITSSVNAVIAVAVSVPLFFALRVPLKSTAIGAMLFEKKEEKKINWAVWIPVVIGFLAISFGAIWMYAEYKKSH